MYSVVAGMAIGAALLAASLQLLVARRDPQASASTWVGLAALFLAISELLTVVYSTTTDFETFRWAYAATLLTYRPFWICWLLFVHVYTNLQSRRALVIALVLEGIRAAALLSWWKTPYFIDLQGIERVDLGWVGVVSRPVGPVVGPWMLQLVAPLLTIGFTGWGLGRLVRDRRWLDAAVFGIVIAVGGVAVLGGVVGDLAGQTIGVMVAELGFLAPVLLMSWMLTAGLAESSAMRRRIASSEARLRSILDGMGDAVLATDPDGRIAGVNPVATSLVESAAAPLVGKRVQEVFGAAVSPLRPGRPQRVEVVLDGTRKDLLVTRTKLPEDAGEVWVLRDVTETVRLERQTQDRNRMESLGRIAGGVAHDFNNVLTGILGSAEILDEPGNPDEVREEAQLIVQGVHRAADLTRRLLAFGRRGPAAREPVVIDALVGEVASILRRTLPPTVELVVRRGASGAIVLGEASSLQAAFLNLGVNASDAMPRGGRIELITQREDDGVRIDVVDEGSGIPAELQERIFDPFFTTKDVGKGTGLGLAMVYGTATAHGGRLQVQSTPGHGATFTTWLPLAPDQTRAASTPASADDGPGRALHVLVVDDEASPRQAAVRALTNAGHRVLDASDITQAIEQVVEHPDLDVVVLDVRMPDVVGAEGFEAIRRIREGLGVLLVSGYPGDSAVRSALAREHTGFLAKPFGGAQLVAAVREVSEREVVVATT